MPPTLCYDYIACESVHCATSLLTQIEICLLSLNVTVHFIWWVTLQWNPVNTDTNGTCHSGRVNQVSVLSRLISEKIYELLFRFAVPVAGKERQLVFIEFMYRDLVSTLRTLCFLIPVKLSILQKKNDYM